MINLSVRSAKKELLDGDHIPFPDIQQNMKELNTVNTLLGGHAITIKGVKSICEKHPGKKITICEIGSGGGDNLQAIEKWCRKKSINAHFIGIDIKKECTAYAAQRYPQLNASWLTSDYADISFTEKPEVIFSSLFCHHFSNEQLVKMLQWMETNSTKGFFINDLHRHPLAFYTIKGLTRLFSRSYLVKNDAPLSVARGFVRKDWITLLEKAGIHKYTLAWKWAFRYLLVCNKQ